MVLFQRSTFGKCDRSSTWSILRLTSSRKRNPAAAGLCSWVVNIVQYYDIVRVVEPKRRALQEANGQLEGANLKLREVRRVGEDLTISTDVSGSDHVNDLRFSIKARQTDEDIGMTIITNQLARRCVLCVLRCR